MRKKKKIIVLFLLLIYIFSITSSLCAYAFNIDFDITTQSVTLVNLDTDTVVFEKDSNLKRSMASTTKIMTYIVTVENIKDLEGTIVNVTDEIIQTLSGTGSSISGLKEGDQLSIYQLLHCLMIPSGNDAALVLANYVGNGKVETFVDMMNKKAIELGCENTHFTNPHGLYDKDHYTTTNDLCKITKYALNLPHFVDITDQTTSYVLGEDKYPLITTNSLIDAVRGGSYYYRYAKGIKTGHLDESGYCLVSTASKGGYSYMCVALGAPSTDTNGKDIDVNGAMVDSKMLYQWAFSNLEIKKIADTNKPLAEVNLAFAWQKDKLQLCAAKNFSTVLPENVDVSSIEIIPNVPDTVKAPIKQGDVVGTAYIKYANETLGVIDLVASETVERSQLLYFYTGIKNVLTSTWFIVLIIILIVLLALYIMVAFIYNKKNRKKKVKKYRRF